MKEAHRKGFERLVAADKSKTQPGLFDKEIEQAWHEPDWSLLDDRRGFLPAFPMEAVPESLHDWLNRAARGTGTTVAHVAVPLIGIASSLIGTARRIRASRSWSQPATLWCAIVGFSGTGKTPGIDATRRAVGHIEYSRKDKIAEQQREHETRVQAAKMAKKKWEKEVEEAIEKGSPAPPKPNAAMDVGPFVTPRLCVSDATVERIAVLLEACPRGMTYVADELSRLFLNMSRYSSGQDNEFWLEAWNGGHYTVERQGRPAVVLQYLLIGVIGGSQPDKLSKSFEGAADGMYARMLFAWPEEPIYEPMTDEVAEIEPSIINALTRIIDMADSSEEGTFVAKYVPLSDEGVAVFEEFRKSLHQGKAELDGREREWWAKGSAHTLRLALTLAYLDWGMRGGAEPSSIDGWFMTAAVQLWREYFWPHSRAALRQIGLSERHGNARRCLKWIRAHRKAEVSREDLRRDALAQSLDALQTQTLIDSLLVRGGWLRLVTTKTPGRALHRYQVNPKLFGDPPTAESARSAESPPSFPTPRPTVAARSAGSAEREVGNGGDPLPALPITSRNLSGAVPSAAEIAEIAGITVGTTPSRSSRTSRNGVRNGDLPDEDFIGPPGDSLDDFDYDLPPLPKRRRPDA